MRFWKRKDKGLPKREPELIQYYADGLEEIDWECYYGNNYGESWL